MARRTMDADISTSRPAVRTNESAPHLCSEWGNLLPCPWSRPASENKQFQGGSFRDGLLHLLRAFVAALALRGAPTILYTMCQQHANWQQAGLRCP